MNNLPKCLTSSQAIMFADDTDLFFNSLSYTEPFRKANEILHKVDSWLTLNTKKLRSLLLKLVIALPPDLEIKLGGNALDNITSIRFLGVTIHEHLTWKSPVILLPKKIIADRGIIQKVKPCVTQKSLRFLYYSMVRSHFQYCISCWCFNNKTLINRLQNTTNKVIRLAFNAKKDDIKVVMKNRNILTIEQTAQLEIVKFTQRYFNNMLPDAFNNFFQHNQQNCDTGRSLLKAKVFLKFYEI